VWAQISRCDPIAVTVERGEPRAKRRRRFSMVPMPGSIICGFDDSESARAAVRVARALGAVLGQRLVLVHVVEPGSSEDKIDAIAERLRRLTESRDFAEDEALWLVDVGHPADRLVAAAFDEAASLVVLGSHGPRSSLLGSVSAEVSRRAPCPVVVVPPGAGGVLATSTAAVSRTDRSARDLVTSGR
jgi:nucleotide-binding universal stress UspA family protein